MADPTGFDINVWFFLVPALIALIPGLVIHSFIIGVNVSDWWRGRSVTPVDHIVTSLGISRLCSQLLYTLGFFVAAFFLIEQDIELSLVWKDLVSNVTVVILHLFYAFFMYANIWLTSLLSIVLCLKISNLHTRLFLYLRRMILHRTGCLIVASLLLSAVNCVTSQGMRMSAVTTEGTYNTTTTNQVFYGSDLFHFFIVTFFPLLFYSISSVLLFVSLYHHTTRMKMSSNLSINLETYYSVMKLASVTFIYNTIYFFGHYSSLIYYYIYFTVLAWLHIILAFLPALHSSYLIYRTAKLRNRTSKVLQNVMDCLFQRKNTESRENIEIEVLERRSD